MAKKLLYRDKDGNEYEVASEGGSGGGITGEYLKSVSIQATRLDFTRSDGTVQGIYVNFEFPEYVTTPKTSVTINHWLGIAHPFVVCIDSDGNTVVPSSVEYISSSKIKVVFTDPFKGTIYLH